MSMNYKSNKCFKIVCLNVRGVMNRTTMKQLFREAIQRYDLHDLTDR